ncbi:MAG: CsbD family protein [Solirubrobacteraceae bacterium]
MDEGKGRLKEAAGSLSGDDELKNEGKADRAKASLKDKVDKVADKAKGALDRSGK